MSFTEPIDLSPNADHDQRQSTLIREFFPGLIDLTLAREDRLGFRGIEWLNQGVLRATSTTLGNWGSRRNQTGERSWLDEERPRHGESPRCIRDRIHPGLPQRALAFADVRHHD